MNLALFDLDHTLIPTDSDHEWGRFLVRLGVVDEETYRQKNDEFYGHYKAGTLDIQAFLRAEIDFLHEVIAEGTPDSCQRHRPPHLGHLPADVRRTSGLTSGRTDPSAGLRTPTSWAMRPSCRSRRRLRAAIDRVSRKRPGIGRAPLFPSSDDMTKPVNKYLADKWLRKAEDLAEIPTQEGSLWHAYWRKWATERKDLLDVDVAAAGGWKTTVTLSRAYQQADPQTILEVVLHPAKPRGIGA